MTKTSPKTETITVELKDAQEGDHFKGTLVRDDTTYTVEGPVKVDRFNGKLFVAAMLSYLSASTWQDVTITREVPVKSNYEKFLDLPIGTVFRIDGDDWVIYVKSGVSHAQLIRAQYPSNYLDPGAALHIVPRNWSLSNYTMTVIYDPEAS